jgi:2'-5' RNA ligase
VNPVRSFLALPIDEDARARLAAAIAELETGLPGARFARPETLHVTLRFLGDASPPALDAIGANVCEAAAGCPPCTAPVTGLGTFPPKGPPRVLFAALAFPDALRELQGACERAAVSAGFAPEPRPFRAHLTLARWRSGARRPPLPRFELGVTRLDRLVLFASRLDPAGPRHTPLATFPFRGAA